MLILASHPSASSKRVPMRWTLMTSCIGIPITILIIAACSSREQTDEEILRVAQSGEYSLLMASSDEIVRRRFTSEHYTQVTNSYNIEHVERPDGTQNVDLPIEEIVEEPIRRAEPSGRWVWAYVTAYCPCSICCGSHANGRTSTGVNVRSGDPHDAYGYAVDPSVIPYGTRIYVPGYWESLQNNRSFIPTEPLKADDTGGAMRRSGRRGILHIDVRYRTHRAAQKWGTREMRVFIYE